MNKLCSKRNIKEANKVQYVINIISNSVFKKKEKTFLYRCHNIHEYRQKFV